MDGVAAIEARIQEITGRLNALGAQSGPGGRLGAPKEADPTDPTSFAAALAQAQDTSAVPASSGALNKAGVDPMQWATDFLNRLGMPLTSENMRAMKAWQAAEGTAARFNPLATTQGGFAGETNFNSVGVKNYTSYEDGLAANVKVINNGLYGPILAALQQGTNANDVATAIANSKWGTGHLVERVLAKTP